MKKYFNPLLKVINSLLTYAYTYGILISEDDWNAIQETLCLNSIPGMTEIIFHFKV